MLVKIHKASRWIVAICDSDLIGKKFEQGKRQLDLTTSFFKGDEKTEQEVREIILDYQREDACFNIAGKQACEIAKELGVVDDNGIIRIQNVPVALVLF